MLRMYVCNHVYRSIGSLWQAHARYFDTNIPSYFLLAKLDGPVKELLSPIRIDPLTNAAGRQRMEEKIKMYRGTHMGREMGIATEKQRKWSAGENMISIRSSGVAQATSRLTQLNAYPDLVCSMFIQIILSCCVCLFVCVYAVGGKCQLMIVLSCVCPKSCALFLAFCINKILLKRLTCNAPFALSYCRSAPLGLIWCVRRSACDDGPLWRRGNVATYACGVWK